MPSIKIDIFMDQAFLSLTAFAVFSLILLFICFELIYFNIAVLSFFIQKKYSYIFFSLFSVNIQSNDNDLVIIGNTNIDYIKCHGCLNFIYVNVIKRIPDMFLKKNISVIIFNGFIPFSYVVNIKNYLELKLSYGEGAPLPNPTLIMLPNISEKQRQECNAFVHWVASVNSLDYFDFDEQNKLIYFIFDCYFFNINPNLIYKFKEIMKTQILFAKLCQALETFPLPELTERMEELAQKADDVVGEGEREKEK
jgi:hypothetical protein